MTKLNIDTLFLKLILIPESGNPYPIVLYVQTSKQATKPQNIRSIFECFPNQPINTNHKLSNSSNHNLFKLFKPFKKNTGATVK